MTTSSDSQDDTAQADAAETSAERAEAAAERAEAAADRAASAASAVSSSGDDDHPDDHEESASGSQDLGASDIDENSMPRDVRDRVLNDVADKSQPKDGQKNDEDSRERDEGSPDRDGHGHDEEAG